MATTRSNGRTRKSAGNKKSKRINKGKALQKVEPLSLNFTTIAYKNTPQ
jgi:hypothetical protein